MNKKLPIAIVIAILVIFLILAYLIFFQQKVIADLLSK